MLEDFEKDRPLGLPAIVPPASPSAGQQPLANVIPASSVASSTGGAGGGVGGGDNGSSSAMISGMQAVMRSYEAELRSPLRNLLMGDLARAMLIQVTQVTCLPGLHGLTGNLTLSFILCCVFLLLTKRSALNRSSGSAHEVGH